MKLKVFTLQLDPATGCFDDAALTAFVEPREVLSVHEHFFVHEQTPTWALLVCYRDVPRPGERDRGAESRTDWRAELSDDERPLYDALRKWRTERARREGRPPYVLFTNRQMAEIARRRPDTNAALLEIDGIGEAKVRDWAEEVLAIVRAQVEAAAPTGKDDTDGA